MQIIGIFGGTFNPVHNGHLALAQTVLDTLHCTQIRFVPAALPPHKATPTVTAVHRAAMVQLAIQHQPRYVLETCELERSGPSYSIDTLRLMRKRFPKHALCLILGQDSYQQLPTWHCWHSLLETAHILVVHRAETEKQLQLHAEHAGHLVDMTQAAEMFAKQPSGLISYLTIAPPNISSTTIRQKLAQPDADLSADIPPAVWQYLQQHRLYHS